MERVIVLKTVVGPCWMQVCAAETATDEEILAACNRENPSGTSLGWATVVRGKSEPGAPVRCADFKDRLHLLAGC